ncbi:Helicase associated domain protein [Glutamicibacter arilaitensis]|uniref:Helicase associated domain protein n=1 Tax=Glutamicibacter arilaitensis TaxID=256701 RepID=UPI003FD4AF5E
MHPEWDMMYAAGLTAREIADRCHQNVATIHAHFQSRERYEPGTRATHETALAAGGVDRPTAQWRTNLNEVQEFQKTHRRLPHHHGDDTERPLHRWVLKQRKAYRNNSMSIPKIVLLEDLTEWSIASAGAR